MSIKTIVAPFGKSYPAFDLQIDITFGDNGEVKRSKFLVTVSKFELSVVIRDLIRHTSVLLITYTLL